MSMWIYFILYWNTVTMNSEECLGILDYHDEDVCRYQKRFNLYIEIKWSRSIVSFSVTPLVEWFFVSMTGSICTLEPVSCQVYWQLFEYWWLLTKKTLPRTSLETCEYHEDLQVESLETDLFLWLRVKWNRFWEADCIYSNEINT